MIQNNLETTAVDSPPTNDSDFRSMAKLKLETLWAPLGTLPLLLLETSPSWFQVATIQSHLYSIVHKFFIISVPSITLLLTFKGSHRFLPFCQMSPTLL